tara:strand:+ start:4460 stop:5425 length:966 start_codon:yes stop_codon:yes gene_type:complete
MNNIILDKDIVENSLIDKKIAIIGYGNQGRAQALNLKDSGLEVRIGLRKNSKSIEKVQADNIDWSDIESIVKWSNLICLMIPDKIAPEIFKNYIINHLEPGDTILLSHGYNIYYKLIIPPTDVNVIMVAPSGGGKVVRSEYQKGYGVPALIAVHQDYLGNSWNICKSYGKAIGSSRVCLFTSTFEEETETDIFGEQAILTGGLPFLINAAYNTLIKRGYSPTVAWFVCYYEIKTIVDLFHEKGFDEFYNMISDTARFGGLSRGRMLIDDSFRDKLDLIINDIKSGKFNDELNNHVENSELYESFSSIEKETKKIIKLINKK